MVRYSIKELEKYSGIKAHTIRIWEQRYKLLKPKRTDTNIRYYDEEQLKYLLNVSLLIEKGFRISQICSFTEAEFNQQIRDLMQDAHQETSDQNIVTHVNGMVLAMLELDELRFEKIISSSLLVRSFEETLIHIVYPFLKRIGVMWRTGEVTTAQEHFIYNLIKQKVIVAIDGLALPPPGSQKFMLFLPKSEFNDLLILLFAYVLKNRGRQCVYLGVDIPFKDLLQVERISKPDALFTFVKAPASKIDTQAYIYELADNFPAKNIFITGNPYFMDELEYPDNVLLIPGINELSLILED